MTHKIRETRNSQEVREGNGEEQGRERGREEEGRREKERKARQKAMHAYRFSRVSHTRSSPLCDEPGASQVTRSGLVSSLINPQ